MRNATPPTNRKTIYGKANRIDRKRRAAASLRKRGHIWWTHFGSKGQFFRRSLGTSDRSEAKREAAKLIALAEAGKIQATASSVDERSKQKSASLEKSYADKKLLSAATKRNQEGWDGRSKESRDQHRAAIKAAANRPGARKLRSETGKSVWQRPGHAERVTAAVKMGWKPKKKRKQQSERIKAACAKPEVQARRLAGRYRAAEKLLQRRAADTDRDAAPRRGRPSMGERNSDAVELREIGWSWRDIARKLDPNFAQDPAAAIERIRIGVRRAKRLKKQETPADGPKTLHNG
jgi:hypothetical protein